MSRLTLYGFAALLVVLAGSAAPGTTLYRWVDADGVVHYSDSPQPGAQAVTVQEPQTYHAPPVPSSSTDSPQTSSAQRAGSSYQCNVTSPSAEQSFFSPEAVSIAVNVQPGLHAGDRLVITMDGKTLSESANQIEVSQPDRGTHTVTAVVRNAEGRDACVSTPVTFYVQRPSLNSPQSPARGH